MPNINLPTPGERAWGSKLTAAIKIVNDAADETAAKMEADQSAAAAIAAKFKAVSAHG